MPYETTMFYADMRAIFAKIPGIKGEAIIGQYTSTEAATESLKK